MIDVLENGRDAVRRHAWAEAVEALAGPAADNALSSDDLELLGSALWWLGRPDESNVVLERAFAGYSEAGRKAEAANAAMTLAYQAFRGLAGPVGGGWLARAERILADMPESAAHAGLVVFQALGALMGGRFGDGIELADKALEIGRRHGGDDAVFMAMSFKGYAELSIGKWRDGLRNIDESAAAASSGQLDLRIASDIFCNTIAACRQVGDLERASQWADEGERWMLRNGAAGYPGICRVHRAELKMLHGRWPEAEREARQACQELERFHLLDSVGYGQDLIGAVRLRMGDLDAAAEAFDRAYEFGYEAQPGIALLQLARGEVADAARSIGRALAIAAPEGSPANRADRARLLPAQVDIALAAGDIETARRAVDELESIAVEFERPFFQAGAMTARGELLLGEEKPSEASQLLGRSWRMWQTSDLPYEAARARLHYAEALSAEGDQAMARRDLAAARSAFERLGATLEVQRVDALMSSGAGGGDGAAVAGGVAAPASRPTDRVGRTFMFTDIVTSTDLLGVIGDEAWAELLRWHDRELRASIADHGGEEVEHTGDGFFLAFERAADAVECAVDIQRRLLRHRREHGFAPSVRIGLHAAEATRRGRNYAGQGVHVAARVGAAATKDEILASADTLRNAGRVRFTVSEPRTVALKGVRTPVEVQSIEWRPS